MCVALAPIGDRILGLGLDPGWAPLHKREVIKRAWRYWQTKGTERGVREALALWFRWEEAQTEPAVLIRLPWGTRPSATPPQWWGYTTRYDAWPTQTWDERQLLGSGDYPQRYTPDWTIVQSDQTPWEYDDRFDQDFVERDVVAIDSPGSMLGPHAVWEHLTPGVDRWNEVFPGIHPLNEESWDIQARVGVFGWIDGGETEPMVVRRSPATVQTQTVYDVEIIGFRYSDMLPFSGIEVETAHQTVLADAFLVENVVEIQTTPQNLSADGAAVNSYLIAPLEASLQALSPDAVVVLNTVAIVTTVQTLATDITVVQSSAVSEPITAEAALSPDAAVVRDTVAIVTTEQTIASDVTAVQSSAVSEPITAQQSLSPDAAVVRDTVAIVTTEQTLASDVTAVQSSAVSEPITAQQSLSPDAAVVRDTVAIVTTEQTIAADAMVVQSSATSEPITAQQAFFPDATVVRNTSEPITAEGAIAASDWRLSESLEPLTALQTLSPDAADVSTFYYDWFYHNIVI